MGQLENIQPTVDITLLKSVGLKPKTPVLEAFLQLCNGSFAIHEIIATLYRKGLTVNFTELQAMLKEFAKHNIFKNSTLILSHIDFKALGKGGLDSKTEIKTEEDLIKWLRKVRLFSSLSDDLLKNIVKAASLSKYKAGEVIIKKGTFGKEAFVMVQGHAGVFTSSNMTSPVATLGPMTVFGESAAAEGVARTADVVSLEDSLVVKVDMSTFVSGSKTQDLKQNLRLRLMVSQVLRQHPLLKTFPTEVVSLILNSCKIERMFGQKTVIQQGDESQNFYFIMSGECLLIKDHVPEVILKNGNYFGEMGILTKKARTASVITKTECVFLVIDSKNFMTLLANNIGLAVVMEGIVNQRAPAADEETHTLNIDEEITDTLSNIPEAIDLV